ncbi:MAG: acylphosphatase [Leptospirales bacterium]
MTSRSSEPVSEAIRVSGRVQGVGFRAFVQKKALQHFISGYVENCSDGTVFLEASGSPEAIESLVQEIWKGPSPVAHVDKVERSRSLNHFPPGFFDIRRS